MADKCDSNMHEGDDKHSPGKPKGILKHSTVPPEKTEVKWDEMNILETYHPANKDYGHMKINEPPTPYSKMEGLSDEEEETSASLDPSVLTDKMKNVSPRKDADDHENVESEGDEEMTDAQKDKHKLFRSKRTAHYNEFSKVKLARELIAKELSELEDDDDPKGMEVGSEGT